MALISARPARATLKAPRRAIELDEPALQAMMRDPRYWDPRRADPAWQRMVEQGYQKLYPDQGRDATGRVRRTAPAGSITLFAEGPAPDIDPRIATGPAADAGGNARPGGDSGGRVQVRAYERTQNGHVVQVAAHTRSTRQASPQRMREIERAAKAGQSVGESKECVALVKYALPELGSTQHWKPGDAVRGPGDPPLAPGTPIAIFGPDGRYENASGRSHAAVVIGEGEENGRPGIYVWEQYGASKGVKKTFYGYERNGKLPYKQATRYHVIERE